MTWGEFKAMVDAKMREQGINRPDDIEIWYIDVTYPDTGAPSIEVTVIDGELQVGD